MYTITHFLSEVSVDESWDTCDWFLEGDLFCSQTAPLSEGSNVGCVGEGDGVSGGTLDDDRTCKIVFAQFREEYSGEW